MKQWVAAFQMALISALLSRNKMELRQIIKEEFDIRWWNISGKSYFW